MGGREERVLAHDTLQQCGWEGGACSSTRHQQRCHADNKSLALCKQIEQQEVYKYSVQAEVLLIMALLIMTEVPLIMTEVLLIMAEARVPLGRGAAIIQVH